MVVAGSVPWSGACCFDGTLSFFVSSFFLFLGGGLPSHCGVGKIHETELDEMLF